MDIFNATAVVYACFAPSVARLQPRPRGAAPPGRVEKR